MVITRWTTQTAKLDILEQNSLAIRVKRVGVIESDLDLNINQREIVN